MVLMGKAGKVAFVIIVVVVVAVFVRYRSRQMITPYSIMLQITSQC